MLLDNNEATKSEIYTNRFRSFTLVGTFGAVGRGEGRIDLVFPFLTRAKVSRRCLYPPIYFACMSSIEHSKSTETRVSRFVNVTTMVVFLCDIVDFYESTLTARWHFPRNRDNVCMYSELAFPPAAHWKSSSSFALSVFQTHRFFSHRCQYTGCIKSHKFLFVPFQKLLSEFLIYRYFLIWRFSLTF